jgi:hypothetical protein
MRWIVPQESTSLQNRSNNTVVGVRNSINNENNNPIPSSKENNPHLSNENNPLKAKTTTKHVSLVSKTTSTAPSLQKGLSYRSLACDQIPDGGACNLVYEPDSSGRLVEHFSMVPLSNAAAVGRWTAGPSKKIATFKFKRNAGRNVLIGNCSAGVQGRKNYCNGYVQFVKSAYVLKGDVTVYDVPTGFKAMPVDVYLYYDDNRPGYQSVKLLPGKPYTTNNLLAVACVPKDTQFYENMTVPLLKWLQDGNNYGYSSKI